MLKILNAAILVLLALGIQGFGQKTVEVQDFSEDYYGKVYLETPTEVFSKGWVAIYQKKTNRQLIKVESDALSSSSAEKANINELPYGEQSIIIHDDFNFDGVKDFALMDGQNSCYGGPSFRIYLAGKTKGRFVFNQSFTRLAQDYCGMFEVDATEKKISTMSKSGCCWHQFSEFTVVNNAPKAVKIIEEDAMNYPFITTSSEIWDGRRMVKTSFRKIEFEENDFKILLSFKTKNDESEVIIFSNEDQLNYIFVSKSGNVEFAYPADSEEANPTFTVDSKKNPTTLSFTNNGATYKIYETAGKIGVEVNVKGKVSDISGNIDSRKGGLRAVVGEKLANLTIKQ